MIGFIHLFIKSACMSQVLRFSVSQYSLLCFFTAAKQWQNYLIDLSINTHTHTSTFFDLLILFKSEKLIIS